MKRFLYLRILAITNLVVIICCFVFIVQRVIAYWYVEGMHIAVAVIITSCALPGIFVLFIFARYYPNKEIPKTVVIGYRIGETIAWMGSAIVLFAGIALIGSSSYFAAFVFTLVALLTLAQLITGGRLLTTIRTNARLILENSFN